MGTWTAGADALIDALRVIIAERVNAALTSTYGGDTIVTTKGYPIPLDQLVQTKLPALSVYRVNAGHVSRGRRRNDLQSQIALDYFGPATQLTKLDSTWPLLHAVWVEAIDAVCDGSALSDPSQTLQSAGLVDLEEGSFAANYNFALGGGNAYPFFAGRVNMISRRVAASDAVPFRVLVARYSNLDDDGESETELNPIVRTETDNVGPWSTGFSDGFWS